MFRPEMSQVLLYFRNTGLDLRLQILFDTGNDVT